MTLYVECGYVEPGYIEGDEICARIPGGGYRKPIKVRSGSGKKRHVEDQPQPQPIDITRVVSALVKEGVSRDQAMAVSRIQALVTSADADLMALKVREREKAMLKEIRRMLDDMDDEDALYLMGLV